jgi:hypothetical protein
MRQVIWGYNVLEETVTDDYVIKDTFLFSSEASRSESMKQYNRVPVFETLVPFKTKVEK